MQELQYSTPIVIKEEEPVNKEVKELKEVKEVKKKAPVKTIARTEKREVAVPAGAFREQRREIGNDLKKTVFLSVLAITLEFVLYWVTKT